MARWGLSAEELAGMKRSLEKEHEAVERPLQKPRMRHAPRPSPRSVATQPAADPRFDLDGVLVEVKGFGDELAECQREVTHCVHTGQVVSSNLVVLPEQWRHNVAWEDRVLSNLETFAKPLRTTGASNLVYKFRKDELRELGSIELMLEESVLRLTNEETPCYNDMAIRELALTLLAAKHRFGLNLHCGALLLSNRQKEGYQPEWRMLMVSDRATGAIDYAATAFKGDLEASAILGYKLCRACANLSACGLFHLDLKLQNILYKTTNTVHRFKVYIIDFDPMYIFHLDHLSVKAAMFVNLLLLAMHVRTFYSDKRGAGQILAQFEPYLIDLYTRVTRHEFAGAAMLDNLRMPLRKKESGYKTTKANTIHEEGGFQKLFAGIVYDYFLNRERLRDTQNNSCEWAGWKFPPPMSQGLVSGPKLLPQMLRFVLYFDKEIPLEHKALFEPAKASAWPR